MPAWIGPPLRRQRKMNVISMSYYSTSTRKYDRRRRISENGIAQNGVNAAWIVCSLIMTRDSIGGVL
jgi:hypothetical protein